ncbi:DUF6485 family protein [Desulfovibrio sp. X2]|uniref:DUF6485 family protein n=1 Tax=Desulfovibrio sp. X2 TaxID=941449 RepID=UPI000A01700B|nr:DUF6485 family protein [Desulfovibrio sp. X2]
MPSASRLAQCPRSKANTAQCTCTYTSCPRHGLCCECLHHHRVRGELPGCYFSETDEKTYNRSVDFFVQRFNK